MTKEELLKTLKGCNNNGDMESNHIAADEALLEFINDKEIEEAYEDIEKWYA